MATIRKMRGRWQAQVRRRGMKPCCKFFDSLPYKWRYSYISSAQ